MNACRPRHEHPDLGFRAGVAFPDGRCCPGWRGKSSFAPARIFAPSWSASWLILPVAQAMAKRGLSAADLHRRYLASVLWFEAVPLPQPVCRDVDDDHVLACAVAAGADLIVSGDDDLLSLRAYEGIPIMTATAALERIGALT